ncbi:hypothetical protein CcrC1_gp486 [Caulobacter phage C1]|nr:hypothetical protein CcrC1_gp486 [Caulobacter phage C1]UTU08699.1 hypothetical protein CcrC2_gp472 [Caulobacter phage C2]UTU09231.1 hypothetical protein CcrJ4_gp484 [Caulobacter phage J4]WGN97361.1 hypothetical protein [Bertelyvirus sp.]WGN97899.1 hypothetical protein [Bertelyvirus sp.]
MNIDFTPIFVMAFIGLVACGAGAGALLALLIALPAMLWSHSFVAAGDYALIGAGAGVALTSLWVYRGMRP